jgi:hypothetical protein
MTKMKIALCFIISYEHVLQKEKIWHDWIEPNKDIINVYFHYKDKNKIKSKWILNNCIPAKYVKPTGYFNVVPAYMSLFSYAYMIDTSNQWFCVLTDTCVPIISPEKFRQLFLSYYNKSIIKCGPSHWNISLHQRANLRLLDKKYHLCNDPWFVLCRYHVQLCNIFMATKFGLFKLINDGGLANESLFAIILQTFNEFNKNKIINSSSSVADWSRMQTPTSPHLFVECNEEDKMVINQLMIDNKYAMFLRKISYKFPDEEIFKIMKTNYGHEYGSVKKIYISSHVYIFTFFIFLFLAHAIKLL